MHHFKAIREFKQELQSWDPKFEIFLSWLTLKFDGWPRQMIGHLSYTTSSFVHHFVAIDEFKLELIAQLGWKLTIFALCDLEIWRMTLKNNKAPPLCYFKICASFLIHRWTQAGVTVWKSPIWVKIRVFCPVRPWNLTWPCKIIGHLSYPTSFVHHFVAIWWIQTWVPLWKHPIWVKIVDFCPLLPWNLTDDLEKQMGTSLMLLQAMCIMS